jgi:amidohydrolase family protein
MWGLQGPEDARRVTKFFAESGAESFKAYQSITRAELAAVIDEAHHHGLKVTGHLCSITYREAADLGIDNIEHGFDFMTDFMPGKQPDVCPYAPPPPKETAATKPSRSAEAPKPSVDDDAPMPAGPITAESPAFKKLLELMVKKKVALTSTIQLDEMFRRPEPVTDEYLGYLTTDIRLSYAVRRARNEPIFPGAPSGDGAAAIRREVGMERAFVAAGGLLMIGPDAISPDMIKGYADLRGLELLVEGGFTPIEAIKVATYNGAQFLGLLDRIGSVSTGKLADLVLVKGDPARQIADIHNIETVFKDGIGFDPAKLKAAVRGQVGLR